MKNLFILFLFLTLHPSFAQTSDLTKAVITDIIEHRAIRNGKIRILPEMKFHIDLFTKKLDQNNGIVYDQKSNDIKDSIHLTVKERDYLTIQFRKDTDNFIWEKEDLKPYEIIEVKDALAFFKQSNTNAVIHISNPLFIRNNTISMVYFSYSVYHDNYSSLCFYKKIKGVWKSWIYIRATKQGDKE